jgi:drug/metabolite transporter (DMT)-like permease
LSFSGANRRGIFAIVVATGVFTTNDSIVKLVAQHAPLGEVLFVRGIMATVLVGSVLIGLGHSRSLALIVNPVVLARSALEALATVLFTIALLHMPLAALSTVTSVSPLIITALAVLIFGEVVGWRRWSAIAVGLLGTLFLVKPTPSSFDVWALLGLLCALSSATRDLLTRRVDPRIPTIAVSLMAAIAVMIAGALLGLGETWRPMQASEIGLLAVAAVFLAAGNFLSVLAFRGVDVSIIAPFRYSHLVWAGLAGFIVFGEIPDAWSVAGAALIVGSGVYAFHREAVRGRAVASPIPPEQ